MKEHIEYIDAMRGFAMAMVVVCHCCTLSMGNNPFPNMYLNASLQIPLFFMISGFFASKMLERSFIGVVYDKFISLVLPAMIMLGLYCWCFSLDFIESLFLRYKEGYWFTFVLFGYVIIFMSLSKLGRWMGLSEKGILCFHLVMGTGVSEVAFATSNISKEYDIFNLLSIIEYSNYIYYVVGAMLFRHRERVMMFLKDGNLIGIGILLYLIAQISEALYGIQYLRFGVGLFKMAIPFIPLLIIWILFSKYTFLSKSSTIGRFFSLVGRRSLDVYFIHYFFLPNLHVWGDYFEMMNIPLIEYLFALTLSIPIIYVSLGIGCVLRLSPLTTSFLLGGKPTRYAGRRIVAGKPQK